MKHLILLCMFLLAGLTEPARAEVIAIPFTAAKTGNITTAATTLYSTARDTTVAFNAFSTIDVGQYFVTPNYRVFRGLIRVATSQIPAGVTVDSVLVKNTITTRLTIADFYMKLVATDDTLNAEYINKTMFTRFKGWVAVANPYTPTILSDSVSTVDKAVGDTLVWRLNAAGLAALNKVGASQYFLLSANDIARRVPTQRENISLLTKAGYMQVWYTPAAHQTFRRGYGVGRWGDALQKRWGGSPW